MRARKSLCLLLALALLPLFAACEGPAPAPTPEPTGESTPMPTPEPTSAVRASFSPGRIEGQRYENASLGIACTLGEGWRFVSDEELSANFGAAEENPDRSALLLEDMELRYDFFAQSEDGLSAMSLTFQDLGALYDTAPSEEEYLDLAGPELEKTMEALGFSVLEYRKNTVLLAGTERIGLWMCSDYRGMKRYSQQLIFSRGGWMAVLELSSFNEDRCGELAAGFEPL